jgi:hypothetical protein
MKATKRFIFVLFLLVFPMLFSGLGYAESLLAPWIGVWTLTADQISDRPKDPNLPATVEIQPTVDGKGLEIRRKIPNQADVKEILIPDGSKQPLDAKNCSGWQSSTWMPETGVIIGSSEVNCKDSGSLRTSSLKIMLASDQMVDILGIRIGDQTRVATRRLKFDHELPSAGQSRPDIAGIAARTAASTPWGLTEILHLSGAIDNQVFQAALLEKNVRINIDAKSLKQMKSAKLPKESIDLLVALAFPEEFRIQTNGKVMLEPLSRSTSSSSGASYLPAPSYYPNTYGYWGNNWIYYGNPLWWDSYLIFPPRYYYPVVITSGGGQGGGGQVRQSSHGQMTSQGYVQIAPANSGHSSASQRRGYTATGATSGAYINTAPAYSGSSGSNPTSAPVSSGSSSAPVSSGGSGSSGGSSASPSGGGEDSGRHAVPR